MFECMTTPTPGHNCAAFMLASCTCHTLYNCNYYHVKLKVLANAYANVCQQVSDTH